LRIADPDGEQRKKAREFIRKLADSTSAADSRAPQKESV